MIPCVAFVLEFAWGLYHGTDWYERAGMALRGPERGLVFSSDRRDTPKKCAIESSSPSVGLQHNNSVGLS